jgi:tRNA G18 (ribose-2'-O)-methylase SpoU
VIHRIASADDPRLDPYRHVAAPRWICDHGLFVAEGRLVVERVLALDCFAVQSIVVNRAAHGALIERLSATPAPVFVCEDATLESITGYHFHRGCVALVSRPPERAPADLLDASRVLGIENVTNPDNIGGLFRTAAAFSADAVLLNRASGDPLYRKAIRTSMGASLRVRYARAEPWLATLARFREREFRIVALTPSDGAQNLSEFAAATGARQRLILLVGGEGAGLDAETIAFADASVRIPIDSSIDSLNVVVAAGIALHEMNRAFSSA